MLLTPAGPPARRRCVRHMGFRLLPNHRDVRLVRSLHIVSSLRNTFLTNLLDGRRYDNGFPLY